MNNAQILRGLSTSPERRTVGDGSIRSAAASALPGGADRRTAAPRDEPFDRGYEQGHAQGRAAGLTQGLAAAQSKIDEEMRQRLVAAAEEARRLKDARASEHQQRLAGLDALLRDIKGTDARRIRALELEAVELAFEALCRLMSPGPECASRLADVIRQRLDGMRDRNSMTVRLHPADLAAMSGDTQVRRLLAKHSHVAWAADAALAPGDCRIDTERGALHVGLHAQLERLKELWLRHASADHIAPCDGELHAAP